MGDITNANLFTKEIHIIEKGVPSLAPLFKEKIWS